MIAVISDLGYAVREKHENLYRALLRPRQTLRSSDRGANRAKMMSIRGAARALSILAMALFASAAAAQPFPNKPIRVVTSEVGGSADVGARLIAQGLSP